MRRVCRTIPIHFLRELPDLTGEQRANGPQSVAVQKSLRVRGGEGGMNWGMSTDIYALPCVKQRAGGSCCIVQQAQFGALCGWGGREVQGEEDICIHIADSFHCTAETNTTL